MSDPLGLKIYRRFEGENDGNKCHSFGKKIPYFCWCKETGKMCGDVKEKREVFL